MRCFNLYYAFNLQIYVSESCDLFKLALPVTLPAELYDAAVSCFGVCEDLLSFWLFLFFSLYDATALRGPGPTHS
jgi:hypothetical protein